MVLSMAHGFVDGARFCRWRTVLTVLSRHDIRPKPSVAQVADKTTNEIRDNIINVKVSTIGEILNNLYCNADK
jgi:hypothetical protein